MFYSTDGTVWEFTTVRGGPALTHTDHNGTHDYLLWEEDLDFIIETLQQLKENK